MTDITSKVGFAVTALWLSIGAAIAADSSQGPGLAHFFNGCSPPRPVQMHVCLGPNSQNGNVYFVLKPGETHQLHVQQWSTYTYNCDGPAPQRCIPDGWTPYQ